MVNTDELPHYKKPWVNRVRAKRNSTRKYYAKLKRMNKDLTFYPTAVWEKERDGKKWLVRLYTSTRASSYASKCKKSIRRKTRRTTRSLYQNSDYKRIYDLQWELC